MNVLLVAHQYWPTPGAATQRLSALTAALRAAGHGVDVITYAPPAGITRQQLGPYGERVHYTAGDEGARGLGRIAALLSFAIGVLRIGRRLQPNVVVSDPPPTAGHAAALVARLRGVRFVYYMADSWGGVSAEAPGLIGRLSRVIRGVENALLRRADAVLAATPGMGRIAESAGACDITVVPNGVPLKEFAPNGEVWSPTPGRPFFLYAGNAGLVHGAHVYVEAAKALWGEGRDFDVVFMGYGADFEKIRASVTNAEDRLVMIGPHPGDRVAAAFRGAIGALSSLRPVPKYADAWPIKSLTGLAAACPPVYAGDGEFADQLREHGLGWVTPWSVEGAISSMRSALDLHHDTPEQFVALRSRCAKFAIDHLDNDPSVRKATSVILNAAENPLP